MNTSTHSSIPSEKYLAQTKSKFMSQVYGWMTMGIALTGFVAWQMGQDPKLVMSLMNNSMLFFGLFIVQIGAVIALSALIRRISSFTAIAIFFGYAALTGITLSTIFIIYTQQSIEFAFITTTAGFAGLSLFGWVTKRDLGPIGTFCHMALWGLIAFGLLSFFIPGMVGQHFNLIYGIGGLVIFSGLTAYDTQRIKAYSQQYTTESEQSRKTAIIGALQLYLDFINLFLSLLSLFGGGRRR